MGGIHLTVLHRTALHYLCVINIRDNSDSDLKDEGGVFCLTDCLKCYMLFDVQEVLTSLTKTVINPKGDHCT